MRQTNSLRDFFRQEVPKDTRDTPLYFKRSIRFIDQMLIVYFSLSFFLLSWAIGRILVPPLLFMAALVIKFRYSQRLLARLNLFLQVAVVISWCSWFVINFGWGLGGQNLLIILILLVFFCLYEPPAGKLVYFLFILMTRILLYNYSSSHAPLFVIDSFAQFVLQMTNSLALFLILAGACILYSSNLQETERQLLLHNEQLQVQAETDPLTKLINRRGLMDIMTRYVEANPDAMYCVAIADIDFFKRVNDTYGHNCGDYVLQQLSALFMERAHDGYSVGRWGGEEFCFFFPGINIDDAGRIVTDLLIAVRKMKIEYEGHSFSITLTAGVEESDYRSPLQDLIESADRKLYLGKENGRDQIVF